MRSFWANGDGRPNSPSGHEKGRGRWRRTRHPGEGLGSLEASDCDWAATTSSDNRGARAREAAARRGASFAVYVRRRTMTPSKEEPGAEETKDAAPEMSPEPLKEHNKEDSPSTWTFAKRKEEFEKMK